MFIIDPDAPQKEIREAIAAYAKLSGHPISVGRAGRIAKAIQRGRLHAQDNDAGDMELPDLAIKPKRGRRLITIDLGND
jgi:hypothetical protein